MTAFLTVDDDANMNTAANTMISIACTTLCNILPSYSCNVPEYINNITHEDIAILPIAHNDTVINDSSRIVVSRLSYDLYVTESVSNFREPYMMKETNYDNTNGIIRTLKNTYEVVSDDEIKNMNLK